MATVNPRRCQHCQAVYVPGRTGYHFDEFQTVRCDACKKAITGGTEEADREAAAPYSKPRKPSSTSGHMSRTARPVMGTAGPGGVGGFMGTETTERSWPMDEVG